MTRAQFLGLLTLPFLTRFGKKEDQSKYEGSKEHPYKIEEDGQFPFKNYAIFIPQGRPGHFYKINNHGKQSVVIDGYQVTELGTGESIEITQ